MTLADSLASAVRRSINQAARPSAIIASGHITGLAVARSLGRRGVPTIVLDRETNGVAFASRHTTATGQVPNPLTHETDFVEHLVALGELLDQPGVLFPTNDDWLLAMLRHRDRLERHYRLPVADLDTVESILDKTRLYPKARELGIPLPDSHVLTDDNVERLATELHYPVILKPAHQRPFYEDHGTKVYPIDGADTLRATYARTRPHKVLVQEIIPDQHARFLSLGSYIGTDRRVQGAFVGLKREQFPAGFGTACLVDGVDVPDVIEAGSRLLATLEYHGMSEVEFIQDTRDGEYKLIDVNTRVWKWIGLPVAAGVDLPWLAYADATGSPEANQHALSQPRWIHTQDYIRLKATAPGTDHLDDHEWRTLLAGPNGRPPSIVDAVADPEDPEPSVRLVRNLLGPKPYYCPC